MAQSRHALFITARHLPCRERQLWRSVRGADLMPVAIASEVAGQAWRECAGLPVSHSCCGPGRGRSRSLGQIAGWRQLAGGVPSRPRCCICLLYGVRPPRGAYSAWVLWDAVISWPGESSSEGSGWPDSGLRAIGAGTLR